MRFDIGRVVALAEGFNYPRVQGTVGERRAADEMAGLLEEAGLKTERWEATATIWEIRIRWILFSFDFCLALWLDRSLVPWRHRAALMVLFVLSVLFATCWAYRSARKAGRTERSRHIVGRPKEGSPMAPRVVFHTRITTSRASWPVAWLLFIEILWMVLGFVLLSRWYEHEEMRHPDITFFFFGGLWLLTLLLVLTPIWRPVRTTRGENRTGLALLAELARTWPDGLAEKVETWFIATPRFLNVRARIDPQRTNRRPTLFIKLDAPGIGPEIVIAGRFPSRELAESAARGLWIPYRAVWRPIGASSKLQRQFRRLSISLRGKHDDSPINPALLAATAQLVQEIVLRWVKEVGSGKPKSVGALDSLD